MAVPQPNEIGFQRAATITCIPKTCQGSDIRQTGSSMFESSPNPCNTLQQATPRPQQLAERAGSRHIRQVTNEQLPMMNS